MMARRMVCLWLVVAMVAAVFAMVGTENVSADDIPAPQQLPGEHSTLCTSDGNIQDDELADYIADQIPKDGNGDPLVKDVKIMFNSCYGGGFADDFERIFGPGGACEGVPWVFGSASGPDELAEGWADGDNTDNGFGSCWTDALAGADSSPTNPTDGSIRDGTSNNVQNDFETARDNDDSGPNHDNAEHPVVASGNGGDNINWTDAGTTHVAVVFGGSQTHQRHHNNIDNVADALGQVWDESSHVIIPIDGGTEQDLLNGINAACSILDADTELVLYFDDHGDTEFNISEFEEWFESLTIDSLYETNFEMHSGWEEGLYAMYIQPDDEPMPYLSLTLDFPITGDDWNISLNGVSIPLPSGNLTGDLQLPADWNSIQTGNNHLEISTSVATDPMVLSNLELCSGPINEIEKHLPVGGIIIPVNILELLAPYLISVALIISAVAMTTLYVKRKKKQ